MRFPSMHLGHTTHPTHQHSGPHWSQRHGKDCHEMIGFWQFHGKGNDRVLTKLYRLGHIHFGEFWNTPWSGLSENIPFISIVTPSKLAGTVCKICPYAQFEVTGIGVRKHPHNITYAVRIVWQIWVSDSAKYGDFKQLIYSLLLKYRDQVEVIAKRRQGTLHANRIHLSPCKNNTLLLLIFPSKSAFSELYPRDSQAQTSLTQAIPHFSKPHATKPLSAILNFHGFFTHQFYGFWGKIWVLHVVKAQVLIHLQYIPGSHSWHRIR